MSLRDEIKPYVDGDGLVSSGLVPPGTKRASGNGVCYTSEYMIMLRYSKTLGVADSIDFQLALNPCFKEAGLLNRAPADPDQEGPDDYYGLTAALKVLGLTITGREILAYGLKHFGFYNNSGSGGWSALLWRQPQLIAAMASAAQLGIIPLFWPFYLYAALVIAFSGTLASASDSSSRRLAWLLIQSTQSSPLTKIASWFWYRRLYKTYGPKGMRAVADIYYHDNHPFQRYWVDKS